MCQWWQWADIKTRKSHIENNVVLLHRPERINYVYIHRLIMQTHAPFFHKWMENSACGWIWTRKAGSQLRSRICFNNEVLSCCLAWYGSTVPIFAIVSASGMYCKADITTLPANKGSFRLPLYCSSSSSSITDNAVTNIIRLLQCI